MRARSGPQTHYEISAISLVFCRAYIAGCDELKNIATTQPAIAVLINQRSHLTSDANKWSGNMVVWLGFYDMSAS